jgi:hypothetical protein
VVHDCIISTQKTEAGAVWVQGQCGEHNDIISKKKKKGLKK